MMLGRRLPMGGPECRIEHEVLSRRNNDVVFTELGMAVGNRARISFFHCSIPAGGIGIAIDLSNLVITGLQPWATVRPDGESRQVSILASAILLSLGFPSGADCGSRCS